MNSCRYGVSAPITTTISTSPKNTPGAGRDEWIPLADAARFSPYSAEYLSLLARKQKLTAKKTDGVWYTTRNILESYLVRQHERAKLQNSNVVRYEGFVPPIPPQPFVPPRIAAPPEQPPSLLPTRAQPIEQPIAPRPVL